MNIRMPNKAKKRPVNLSIDETLLAEARGLKLNLSAVLERALEKEQAQRWLAENQEAIEAYNRRIEANGVWSDGWRRW
jgi:antitoxin CcdA